MRKAERVSPVFEGRKSQSFPQGGVEVGRELMHMTSWEELCPKYGGLALTESSYAPSSIVGSVLCARTHGDMEIKQITPGLERPPCMGRTV